MARHRSTSCSTSTASAIVGFDVVFAERDDSSGIDVLDELAKKELQAGRAASSRRSTRSCAPSLDYDGLFAKAIKGRPVVLGYYFNSEEDAKRSRGAFPSRCCRRAPSPAATSASPPGAATAATCPSSRAAPPSAGHFNPLVDDDGVSRRVPMLVRVRRRLLRAAVARDGAHADRLGQAGQSRRSSRASRRSASSTARATPGWSGSRSGRSPSRSTRT